MDIGDFDSSLRPSNVTCYGDFALMCTGDDGNGVEDSEGNDSDSSKQDEEEVVRMDLTDDLLHMVHQAEKMSIFYCNVYFFVYVSFN